MDAGLLTSIRNPGWGLLAVVILLVFKYPSFLSELSKLFNRLSKSKEPANIEYGNFKLFKLERIRPETGIVNWAKTISTICSVIVIAVLSCLYWLVSTKPPEGGIVSSLSTFFLVFLSFLPIIIIIDNYKSIKSSVTLELNGNPETLLRFCLKLLFDTRATITKFDAEAGQIEARLYGNEITIRIKPQKDSRNEFTLNSSGRLINTLIYSVEYRRSINNLVRSLCYQQKTN